MRLSDLRPTPGSVRRPKRVGRGNASGHGTYSTRGGKGQTARSGYRMPPAFEGGQTPLWKRVPKRGFKNPPRRTYAFVNVGQLHEAFPDGAEITPAVLQERGLIEKVEGGVKILGDGPLAKRLIVKAHKFSKSAREKILAAGGQVVALIPEEAAPPPSPQSQPVEEKEEEKQEKIEERAKRAQTAKQQDGQTKKAAKSKTPKRSEGKTGK